MKLIIGLWNPWKTYDTTRHNVGFMFLDYIAKKHSFEAFKKEEKFKARVANGNFGIHKMILLKPETFMNLSGESVRKVIDFYKIPLEDIIVIYDDMTLPFWKIRFRSTWSAGGHNGIKSIIAHITEAFKRIKIGIDYDPKYDVSDWVLSRFSTDERIEMENEVFEEVEKMLEKEI